MHRHLLVPALLLAAALPCAGQDSPLTAEEIMARVAANQDRAEAERTRYVYVQHARIASRKGRTLRCEEITDTRVTPQEKGSTRTLLTLEGRLLKDGHYLLYGQLPKPGPHENTRQSSGGGKPAKDDEDETDRDLVENLRKNLTDDTSKNGLHAGLFPLSSRAQAEYTFTLKGRQRRNGVDTFHIAFAPRDKEEYGWRGDVWVDTAAFEPVVIQTAMSRNIPFAVRTLLGTSVPGLGFAATYAPQPDGVWFPVSFGSEFKINVLFFFHRTVTLAVENRDFAKTHVQSHIVADEPAPAP